MKNLITIMLLFVSLGMSSQNLGTYQKLEVGINGISMSLEMPVSKNITIEPALGFGPGYDLHSDENGGMTERMDWRWALLEPSFHGSVYGKFFYTRASRVKKGKSLLLNSGNFIGIKVKYISRDFSDYSYCSNTMLFNLNWGGQFNMGKHWLYSYSVGIGYGRNLDISYGMLYPAFDLKVAYVFPFFSKRK